MSNEMLNSFVKKTLEENPYFNNFNIEYLNSVKQDNSFKIGIAITESNNLNYIKLANKLVSGLLHSINQNKTKFNVIRVNSYFTFNKDVPKYAWLMANIS